MVQHDEREESAGEVLDEMLATGRPAFLVGNTVAEFMRDVEAAIEERREYQSTLDAWANEPAPPEGDGEVR